MKILADAVKDEAGWLRKRRGYVSASDIFKLLTHDELVTMGWWKESWMNDTPEDVIERKRTNEQPVFKNPTAVEWGKAEEDHNRQLFEDYSGIITAGCHYFIGHERYPFLATTLDGFSFVPEEWDGLARPEMFVSPEYVTRAINALPRGERCLLEMKQGAEFSTKAWEKGYDREPRDRAKKSKVILGKFVKNPPTCVIYYHAQIQTQMALAGFDWNLAVCKGGASALYSHSYEASAKWLDILDAVNDRVAQDMTLIRKELKANAI